MRTRSLSIVLLFVTSALLAGLVVIPVNVRATTLYVGGAGPGNYTTIQEAIDAASPGDTVYVFSGTYYENVVIGKTLSLKGENRDTTTIDGGHVSDIIIVDADRVNVSGFTITNSSGEVAYPIDPGIRAVGVDNLGVTNNSFRNHRYGISFSLSYGNVIRDNTFWNITRAAISSKYLIDSVITHNIFSKSSDIDIWESWGNTISNNVFEKGSGIYIDHSRDNLVANNNLTSKSNAIVIYSSSENTVTGNMISLGGCGINMWFGGWNVIHRNRIADSGTGIHMFGSSKNTLTENDIIGNYEGIWLTLTEEEYWRQNAENAIYHNNFIDNRYQACDSGFGTQWDDGYPSGGNYWSDYTGLDIFSGPNQTEPGNDGIGDEPRVVHLCPSFPYEHLTPEGHEDRYPLMEPPVVPPAPPSKPLGLQATPGIREIDLEWRPSRYDGGSPITNYSIYRGHAPGTETLLVEIGNVTTFVDTGLEMGKTYYYQVSARNANGEGPRSNEVSVTVPVASKPPLDLIRAPEIDNITVNWTPPGGGGGSRICDPTVYEDRVWEAGIVSSRRSRISLAGGMT